MMVKKVRKSSVLAMLSRKNVYIQAGCFLSAVFSSLNVIACILFTFYSSSNLITQMHRANQQIILTIL